MNVLIVDDNAINRKLLRAVLQSEQWNTCEAEDGQAALEILGSESIDAIISDILMPRMDGYRFCFEVRRQARFSDIPFVFYSSTYISAADEKLGLELGGNAFLRKPAGPKEMIEALSVLMERTPSFPLQPMELPQELKLMKEYSEQLVAKLEEKNTELLQRTQELQKLSRRLLEARETEQRHLARELHDEIGQALNVLKLGLEAGNLSVSGRPSGGLTDSIRLVDQMLQQVRSMALNLRPSILDDLGLVAALRWYTGQHFKRTGLAAVLEAGEDDRRYDPLVETACFRVVQEALTNVVRHAHAKQVTVSLSEADGVLHLRVRDDGTGFDVPAARQRAKRGTSFGLLGMQERVSLVGGQMEFESTPGRGTELRAQFPSNGPATAEADLRKLQP